MRKTVLDALLRLHAMSDKDLSIAHSGGFGATKRTQVLADTRIVLEELMARSGPLPMPPKDAA